MITEAELLRFCPKAKPFLSGLQQACDKFQINRPLRIAHFMAQLAHESGGFRATVENLNYSAEALSATWPSRFDHARAQAYARQPEKIAERVYGGRMGNGPEGSGDGWKYRGRGLLQATGKDNYRRISQALYGDARLLDDPQLLEHPVGAAISAGQFWHDQKLNDWADRDDLKAVSGIINCGSPNKTAHGLNDRREWLKKAKDVWHG